MDVRWLIRSTFSLLLLAAEVPSAAAQPGPPCGPDLPIKCTPGKDAAIVLGFVGAGVVALYLGYRMDHPRNEMLTSGCAAQADGVMTLVEDNTQTVYLMKPLPRKVKAGERVVLRGKKIRDGTGKNIFRAKKFVQDEGPCETRSPSAGQESSP